MLLLLTPVAAQAQLPADWTGPFEPVQIADNRFYADNRIYMGSAGLSAFLVTSSDGHVSAMRDRGASRSGWKGV